MQEAAGEHNLPDPSSSGMQHGNGADVVGYHEQHRLGQVVGSFHCRFSSFGLHQL